MVLKQTDPFPLSLFHRVMRSKLHISTLMGDVQEDMSAASIPPVECFGKAHCGRYICFRLFALFSCVGCSFVPPFLVSVYAYPSQLFRCCCDCDCYCLLFLNSSSPTTQCNIHWERFLRDHNHRLSLSLTLPPYQN